MSLAAMPGRSRGSRRPVFSSEDAGNASYLKRSSQHGRTERSAWVCTRKVTPSLPWERWATSRQRRAPRGQREGTLGGSPGSQHLLILRKSGTVGIETSSDITVSSGSCLVVACASRCPLSLRRTWEFILARWRHPSRHGQGSCLAGSRWVRLLNTRSRVAG